MSGTSLGEIGWDVKLLRYGIFTDGFFDDRWKQKETFVICKVS